MKLNASKILKAINLYEQKKYSAYEISKLFGCTPQAIYKTLRKYGVEIRSKRQSTFESIKRMKKRLIRAI